MSPRDLEVEPKGRGAKELRHPTLGPLRFDLEVLRFDDVVDRLLVTWLPADEATTNVAYLREMLSRKDKDNSRPPGSRATVPVAVLNRPD